MNKIWISFILLLFVSACKDDGTFNGRRFWVVDTTKDYVHDPTAWHTITASKRAESNNVIVYVDVEETEITDAMANNMAIEFDNKIYPRLTTNIGSPVDVDRNDKIILLIFDIIDGANIAKGDPYIGGYFYSADLFSQSSIDTINPVIKSNQAEILYIDAYPLISGNTDINQTIAHEFTHLLITSYNLVNDEYPFDTWIEEGITESASHMVYGEQTNRISYLNSEYFDIGHSLFAWSENSSIVLSNYSLSYLFMQFLRSQSTGKNSIFKDIIESSYKDYRAITTVLDNDTNLSAWGATSEERFSKFLLRFYAANSGQINNNLYLYDSEITTKPQMALSTDLNIDLGNGAGVVKKMGGVFASGSAKTNFVYLSVSDNGNAEDFDATDDIINIGYFIAVYKNYETAANGDPVNNPVNTPLPVNPNFIDPQAYIGIGDGNVRGNSLYSPGKNGEHIRDFRMNNNLFRNSRGLHFKGKIDE